MVLRANELVLFGLLIFCLAATLHCSAPPPPPGDLLLVNANAYTLSEDHPRSGVARIAVDA